MSKPLDSQIIEALAGTFAEAMPVLVSLGDFAHLRVVAALTSQLPDSTVAAEATQVLVQKLTTLDDAKPLTEAIRALAQRCPQDDLGMALKDLLQGSAFFVGYELGKLDPNSPLYGAFAPRPSAWRVPSTRSTPCSRAALRTGSARV